MFHLFPGSNISEMRKSYKDAFLKKHNMKLGFMSAFVKAAAYALADQPAVNAGTDLNFTYSVTSEMVSACLKPCMRGVRPPRLLKDDSCFGALMPNLKTTHNLFTAPGPP